MLINLSELFTCEGKTKEYEAQIGFDDIAFNGEIYRILKKDPVRFVIVNAEKRKFTIDGSVSVTVEIPCARCLEPVAYVCNLDLSRELVAERPEEAGEESSDEQPYLNGYNLDVDQLVRNELLLNLPMKVLCREDCKGICNRCGMNLNLRTCTCDTRSLDPRMSVIQDIFKQSKEV